MKMYLNEGTKVSVPVNIRTWQLWPGGSDFKVKDTRKGLWELFPVVRKATEARHVSGLSPHGGLDRHYMKL